MAKTKSDLRMPSGLIILDRDGVLNEVVVDQEHGTINSPMNLSEVKIIPGVALALKKLVNSGFLLAVATNQPAVAKKKTTMRNSVLVHRKVIRDCEQKFFASETCYHRSEDNCKCRKPKPLMLHRIIERFQKHYRIDNLKNTLKNIWMIGDGVTDIEAGVSAKVKTAFLGPRKCDACKIFRDRNLEPDYWGKNLSEFVAYLTKKLKQK